VLAAIKDGIGALTSGVDSFQYVHVAPVSSSERYL
jgi:hypothetical protein